MSNRVEDLERQVQELQAAVNGLTEELVETKARLRDLEAAEREESAPPDEPADEPAPEPAERTTKSDVHADVVEANPDAKRDATSGERDDAAPGEGSEAGDDGEAAKSEEGDESSGDGESEESDIIVA
ncbi:MAG: bZIP transcription factor [Haloferacaceae archaeon]